jgi:hypothetical protein
MSEWIAVGDRLPSEQGRVIISTSTGLIETTLYSENREFLRRQGSFSRKTQGKESGYFQIAYWSGYRITHWMPLPDLPDGICPF